MPVASLKCDALLLQLLFEWGREFFSRQHKFFLLVSGVALRLMTELMADTVGQWDVKVLIRKADAAFDKDWRCRQKLPPSEFSLVNDAKEVLPNNGNFTKQLGRPMLSTLVQLVAGIHRCFKKILWREARDFVALLARLGREIEEPRLAQLLDQRPAALERCGVLAQSK